MSNKTYTVKTNLGEDGVGEMWTFEQAQAHVVRCEYVAHKINYEIVEHIEEDIETADITDTLLTADDSARGRKSRRKSSD